MKTTKVAEPTNLLLFFPDEIVFEILTWLPVKSLCRFKCVSKSWLSTISATRFVDSHFSRSKSRPKLLITISCESPTKAEEKPSNWGSGDVFQHLFIADPATATEQENERYLALTHQLKIPVNTNFFEENFPKSVAGLTSNPNFRRSIRITNPSTKSQVVFPREIPSGSMYNLCFSIGFDPIDSKYKVLEFLSKDELVVMEYNVVTVGDYGNFRSVEDAPLNHMKGITKQEICVNGVIYYIADLMTFEETRWKHKSEYMVAFDVRSEKFQVVEFYCFDGTRYKLPTPWRFMEFEGKVAIINHPYPKSDLEIWVLEDFENQDWSLMYSGIPDPIKWGEYSVVGSTFSGEVVLARHLLDIYDILKEDYVPCPTLVPFSLLFFDPKTEDFWSWDPQLPPGFEVAMLDDVQISVMGHVETLRSPSLT